MQEHMEGKRLLSKLGKWGPLVGGIWIASHIVVPLALLRIPAFQKYLISLDNMTPFNIPGIG